LDIGLARDENSIVPEPAIAGNWDYKKLNAYDDVEWQKLCAEHKLRTLRTNEMDLFSEKHKCAIEKTIKKGEKICVNEAELAKQMAATYMQLESKNKP
jgi:hypothetical protein